MNQGLSPHDLLQLRRQLMQGIGLMLRSSAGVFQRTA